MKSIVLTGATSMIGIALIKQCVQHGIKVVAFVRPNSKKLNRLPNSDLITIIECSLDSMKDFNRFDKNMESPEVFYHLGWDYTDKQGRYISDKQLKNVQYTLDAVHLAKRLGCRRFIGAGSQAEYGSVTLPLNKAVPVNPNTAYGVAKYTAGKLSKIECEKLDLEHIWVRILSVYGNHDNSDTLINTFITSCKNNQDLPLSLCEHIWDYLHEDDAGRAFIAIGTQGKDRKIYCLGSGVGRPLKEYLEIIKNMINPEYNPQYGQIPYSESSVRFLCADITELTCDTGWKPEISFEEAIHNTVRLSKSK